ncbi:MAG: hypothetical protein MI976_02670 [Pseudomonadales bacterium]|nr:hypothetical protein [Pseudomonadales bacterium]
MRSSNIISKVMLSLTPVIFSLGGLKAYAEQPTESDLNECYNLQFVQDSIDSHAAFAIAQCFSNLATAMTEKHLNQLQHQAEGVDNILISNRNVVLHYAESWYKDAAFKGHPVALEYVHDQGAVLLAAD